MNYFDWLPEELLIEIFLYLRKPEVKAIVQVEPYNKVFAGSRIWKYIFLKQFPLVECWSVLGIPENMKADYYAYIYLRIGRSYDRFLEIPDITKYKLEKDLEKIIITDNMMADYMMLSIYGQFGDRKLFLYTKNDEYYFKIESYKTPVDMPGFHKKTVPRNHTVKVSKQKYFNMVFYLDYHYYILIPYQFHPDRFKKKKIKS